MTATIAIIGLILCPVLNNGVTNCNALNVDTNLGGLSIPPSDHARGIIRPA